MASVTSLRSIASDRRMCRRGGDKAATCESCASSISSSDSPNHANLQSEHVGRSYQRPTDQRPSNESYDTPACRCTTPVIRGTYRNRLAADLYPLRTRGYFSVDTAAVRCCVQVTSLIFLLHYSRTSIHTTGSYSSTSSEVPKEDVVLDSHIIDINAPYFSARRFRQWPRDLGISWASAECS